MVVGPLELQWPQSSQWSLKQMCHVTGLYHQQDQGSWELSHLCMLLLTSVSRRQADSWSMFSISSTTLGVNEHSQYLGLSVLTWHSTAQSISHFSLQRSEKLLYLNERKAVRTTFQTKEENAVYKDDRLREEEELQRATVSFLPTRAEFIWLCSAHMHRTNIPLRMCWLRAAEPHRAFLRHFSLRTATAFLFKTPAFTSSCLEQDQSLHFCLYPGGCEHVAHCSQ